MGRTVACKFFSPKKSSQKTKVLLFENFFTLKSDPIKKAVFPGRNRFSKVGIAKKFFPEIFRLKKVTP
jgi:hypothetical protein